MERKRVFSCLMDGPADWCQQKVSGSVCLMTDDCMLTGCSRLSNRHDADRQHAASTRCTFVHLQMLLLLSSCYLHVITHVIPHIIPHVTRVTVTASRCNLACSRQCMLHNNTTTTPTNMSSVTQFIECQERPGKRMKNEKIKTSVRGRERIE